jgi:hypothetical protein
MTKGRIIRRSLLALVLIWFILIPTINAFRVRHSLAVALDGAASVRLEEFVYGVPLATVDLPRDKWPQVLAATPIVPDAGWPGSVKLCFIPHHRVVITSPQHQQFAFSICFACDQSHTKPMGIFATPYLWCTPLRRLFTNNGIRVRTGQEYHATWLEHTHEPDQEQKESPKP